MSSSSGEELRLDQQTIRGYSWKSYIVPSARNINKRENLHVIYENELQVEMLQNEEDHSLFVMVPLLLRQRQLIGRQEQYQRIIGKPPEGLIRQFKELGYYELDGGHGIVHQIINLYREQNKQVGLVGFVEDSSEVVREDELMKETKTRFVIPRGEG